MVVKVYVIDWYAMKRIQLYMPFFQETNTTRLREWKRKQVPWKSKDHLSTAHPPPPSPHPLSYRQKKHPYHHFDRRKPLKTMSHLIQPIRSDTKTSRSTSEAIGVEGARGAGQGFQLLAQASPHLTWVSINEYCHWLYMTVQVKIEARVIANSEM